MSRNGISLTQDILFFSYDGSLSVNFGRIRSFFSAPASLLIDAVGEEQKDRAYRKVVERRGKIEYPVCEGGIARVYRDERKHLSHRVEVDERIRKRYPHERKQHADRAEPRRKLIRRERGDEDADGDEAHSDEDHRDHAAEGASPVEFAVQGQRYEVKRGHGDRAEEERERREEFRRDDREQPDG